MSSRETKIFLNPKFGGDASNDDDVGFWETMMWVIFIYYYLGIWIGLLDHVKILVYTIYGFDKVLELEKEKLERKSNATEKEKEFDLYYKNFKYSRFVNDNSLV